MKSTTALASRIGCSAAALLLIASTADAQVSTTPSPDSPPPAANTAPPALTKEQISYLFGLEFGEQMHRVGISDQVSLEDVKRGVQAGLDGKTASPEDQQQVQDFARQQMLVQINNNKKAGRDFLEHNSHEKGVKTTPSGLEYKVIAAGNVKAPAVAPTDEVTVQYRGTFIDGTEFDSSYKSGHPVTFRANAVIQGWQEALLLMKPGAKYQLFIPTELGYGDRGNPGIPPGSALVFDVELVSAKPASGDAASPAPTMVPHGPPPPRHTTPAPQTQQSQ